MAEPPKGKACISVTCFSALPHPTDSCGPSGLPLTPNAIRIAGRVARLVAGDDFDRPSVLSTANPAAASPQADATLKLAPPDTASRDSINEEETNSRPDFHRHLCKHVGIHRAQAERVFVITEHWDKSLETSFQQSATKLSVEAVRRVTREILQALASIHSVGIASMNLSALSVRFDGEGAVKISDWALYDVTEAATTVPFSLGVPGYMSPSAISTACSPKTGNPKEDIWATGILLLEMLLGHHIWPDIPRSQDGDIAATPVNPSPDGASALANLLRRTLKAALSQRARLGALMATADKSARPSLDLDGDVTEDNVHDYMQLFLEGAKTSLDELPKDLVELAYLCLSPLPSQRPSAVDLLDHPALRPDKMIHIQDPYPTLRSSDLAQRADQEITPLLRLLGKENISLEEDQCLAASITSPFYGCSSAFIHHLWSLMVSDAEAEFVRKGHIHIQPPIYFLPRLVRHGFSELRSAASLGSERSQLIRFELDLRSLEERLRDTVDISDIHTLIMPVSKEQATQSNQTDASAVESLPQRIRERDVAYQYRRGRVFARLLSGLPYTKPHLQQQARKDIPPFYRGRVWACLLDVDPVKAKKQFRELDKLTEHKNDRQLDVDIPRCHQYNELLASPTGHIKLRRVLKAWIRSTDEFVYWQGLDSLCAPFLCLHFTEEHIAFGCLSSFVNNYLRNFFLKDNTHVMHEYLALFWQQLAHHDPLLWAHLDSMGFMPDLFAISWFLTCFAHVFSVDNIFTLWDQVILSDSTMALHIGVAILLQMRETLLQFDFNECILHFGDSPDVDLERTIADAQRLHAATPASMTARRHSSGPRDTKMPDYTPPEVAVLRQTPVPFMAASDLLLLCQGQRPGALLCDTRQRETFDSVRAIVPRISVPLEEVVDEEGLLYQEAADAFSKHRHKKLAIIGESHQEAVRLARALVLAGIENACIITGGADTLVTAGLLVPSS